MTDFLLGLIIGIIISICFYELILEAKIKEKKVAGTITGGKNAAKTNKKRYGKDFYDKIGALGGKAGHTGGFWANRELARIAGKKGGTKSRRGKK